MRKQMLWAGASLLALTLLAGCTSGSGDDKDNGIVNATAIAAFQTGARDSVEASDASAKGTLLVNGLSSTYSAEFAGTDGQATVKNRKQGTFKVIKVGQSIFVQGSIAFWKPYVGAAQATKINTRWARSRVDGPLASFTYFVDRNSFYRASGRIKKGPVETVNGRECLTIIDPKQNTDSTWWFDTKGKALARKFKSGKLTRLTYAYDDVIVVQTPPAEQVVDISGLQLPAATVR